MSNTLTVYAPASTGNLSVGFDALGLALAPVDGSLLGDLVHLRNRNSRDWQLDVQGPFKDALPEDPELNVVMKCCRRFESTARNFVDGIFPLDVTLEKMLPVGSGLGSSASSIVATLVALNNWFGRPLNRPQLLSLMAEAEGGISGEIHLDNIAPSLLGGLRLCMSDSAIQEGLPWPGRWQIVICWPGTRIDTHAARMVLPEKFNRSLLVAHGAQFARFVHALHVGDSKTAAECINDMIAEPHRQRLLPGFTDARKALTDLGALSVGISGSGPTVFAIVNDSGVAQAARHWLQDNYCQSERAFATICRADLAGARQV
ncbi:MAG: homoserine kinase [Xanthomonadales bacterium]|nr:homoserine kinase [Gammaproteobacteria bacterium]NNE05318.1 homoserine kinase [Xanthomonadales bacterium]NNL95661.1 homoserine kinase [Xanthomonadales bacterium]